MSKLDDIIDDTPIVHQFGCPALERDDGGLMDYTCTCGNTHKIKKHIKDLMLELIPGDNYAPTGSQIAVEAVNGERQRMRQKVKAL